MSEEAEDDESGYGVAPSPRRVLWTMKYRPQQDHDDEEIFEGELALAALLMNEVIFINSRHWKEHDKGDIAVCVLCNDVFAWGCSDAEDLPHGEIENVYRMWLKDPHWGAAIWCMLQRKEMPQKPVEDRIRKAGIWDLDSLGLAENTTDERMHAWLQAALASASVKP